MEEGRKECRSAFFSWVLQDNNIFLEQPPELYIHYHNKAEQVTFEKLLIWLETVPLRAPANRWGLPTGIPSNGLKHFRSCCSSDECLTQLDTSVQVTRIRNIRMESAAVLLEECGNAIIEVYFSAKWFHFLSHLNVKCSKIGLGNFTV